MKPPILIIIAALLFLASCNAYYAYPGSGYGPPHFSKQPFSRGAISMLESYRRLFATKPVCDSNQNGIFYGVTSTMQANDYIMFSQQYQDSVVSFASTFFSGDTDSFRNIWDYTTVGFTYYGACVPVPNYFPYPKIGYNTDDVFLSKLIPVDSFQQKAPNPVWPGNTVIKGIPIKSIRQINNYYLESAGGFIAKNYPDSYSNPFLALGIVCNVCLNTGQVVPCYLINNDMVVNPPQRVRWKEVVASP